MDLSFTRPPVIMGLDSEVAMNWIKEFPKACLEAFIEGFGRVFTRNRPAPVSEKERLAGVEDDRADHPAPTDPAQLPDPNPDRGHRRMMGGRH